MSNRPSLRVCSIIHEFQQVEARGKYIWILRMDNSNWKKKHFQFEKQQLTSSISSPSLPSPLSLRRSWIKSPIPDHLRISHPKNRPLLALMSALHHPNPPNLPSHLFFSILLFLYLSFILSLTVSGYTADHHILWANRCSSSWEESDLSVESGQEDLNPDGEPTLYRIRPLWPDPL